MDKILELTNELKQLIEDTELVKEFRRVEYLYKTNEELLQISSDIKKAESDNNIALKQELVKKGILQVAR